MICTFFGHKSCPPAVAKALRNTIEELIIKNHCVKFYVGNNGSFDMMVYNALKELKMKYPHISYRVVISYIPIKKATDTFISENDTIIPDGIENVPRKYAISFRNEWMIKKSDTVIAYVNRPYGGAHKYLEIAKKRGKNCINLCEISK